jgi:hypothetical protein
MRVRESFTLKTSCAIRSITTFNCLYRPLAYGSSNDVADGSSVPRAFFMVTSRAADRVPDRGAIVSQPHLFGVFELENACVTFHGVGMWHDTCVNGMSSETPNTDDCGFGSVEL